MKRPYLKDPIACFGCKEVFRSMGALGQHAKYSTTCTPHMRFWGKVEKTATCWLWKGAVQQKGYGLTSWEGRHNLVVHRLVWMMTNGYIPDGLEVAHKCDVRNCVNPDHLFLATHQENIDDMVAKGRQVHGEKNLHAKLNAEAVRVIRAEYRCKGRTSNSRELAARYGVGQGAITAVIAGLTWRTVK